MKEQIIQAMQQIIQDLTPANIASQQQRMERLFYLYSELTELFPDEGGTAQKTNEDLIAPLPVKNNVTSDCSVDVINKVIIGFFEQGILGGEIKVKKVTIKVPEMIVRTLDLQHGDLVKADYKNMQNLLCEKIKDSSTAEKSPRAVVTHGIVTDDYLDGNLVVQEQFINGRTQKIKIDEAPFTFIITDYDRQKYNLQPGDLLDIAYAKHYPQTYKVIWKHHNSTKKAVSNPIK